MSGSIKIARQLEQMFQPYRMMFKELKEKRAASLTIFPQRKEKTKKILKHILGAASYSQMARGGFKCVKVLARKSEVKTIQ
jgi:hypothetical protein